MDATRKDAVVELSARDLNGNGGIFCPSPKAGMKLWNTHPRIFLDLATNGEARCAYCGTIYRLAPGEQVHGGH